ncbi:hypothetical protein [Actinophytocola gossypii]|uniref:Uncharacterized protein n=1 Tax=Actinophytocola gossypii TaxID=2812003 RepID=A0ABT2JJX5_9PSEU|nr:hypothetical protein [Actinophytocola gossypii]MCT2588188.1 hypothetical protein [Actinophytocola gossypii]
MENITLMRTPGLPVSGATGAFPVSGAFLAQMPQVKCVHAMKPVRRERISAVVTITAATTVRVQAPIAAVDYLSDPSALTRERRT